MKYCKFVSSLWCFSFSEKRKEEKRGTRRWERKKSEKREKIEQRM